MNSKWSKPYYGITHLGDTKDRYRVTVCAYASFAILHCWYPGCGFSPIEKLFQNTSEAKASGEQWLKDKSA